MTIKNECKILFITFNDINDLSYGGGQCSSRNVQVLRSFGAVDIYVVKKRSTIASLFSIFTGHFPPTSRSDFREIEIHLRRGSYSMVFFDNSLFGRMAKYIYKSFNLPAICFLHNIETEYVGIRFGRNPSRFIYKYLAWRNEKEIAESVDKIIALNIRDAELFLDRYGRKCDYVVPITFISKFETEKLKRIYENRLDDVDCRKTCLFVGSIGRSTLEGVKWFVNNVAPFVDSNIRIVGKGFDSVSQELCSKNVEVIGFVEDLEDEYLSADCVIVPILSGAGMKVKVAEALMYGKTVFGTGEAFEGYDIDFERVGAKCDSADEFIKAINGYLPKSKKYNSFSRSEFDNKYSGKLAYDIFEAAISSILN